MIMYKIHGDHPVLKRIDVSNLSEKGKNLLFELLKGLEYENIITTKNDYDEQWIKNEIMVLDADDFVTIGYINNDSQIKQFEYLLMPLLQKSFNSKEKPTYI